MNNSKVGGEILIKNGAGASMGAVDVSDDIAGGILVENDGRMGKIKATHNLIISELIKEGEELITSPNQAKAERWYNKLIKAIPEIAEKAAKFISAGVISIEGIKQILELIRK